MFDRIVVYRVSVFPVNLNPKLIQIIYEFISNL